MTWAIPCQRSPRPSYTNAMIRQAADICSEIYYTVLGNYRISIKYVQIERPTALNFINLAHRHPLHTLHRAERLYTVQLGFMQGVYQRFSLQKLIRYTPATLYTVQGRPLYMYLRSTLVYVGNNTTYLILTLLKIKMKFK